jgi:hypothetical protein
MSVGADHAAIHMVQGPAQIALRIVLPLQLGQDLVPDAGFDPPLDARGEGLPGGARAQHPQDAVEHQPMVLGRMPRLGLWGRPQRLQRLPLSVC